MSAPVHTVDADAIMQDVAVDSLEKILNVGVIGALCIILMVIIVYREKYWQDREKTLQEKSATEIKDERANHDKTRSMFIEEVRSNAETLMVVREQLKQQQTTFDAMLAAKRGAPVV